MSATKSLYLQLDDALKSRRSMLDSIESAVDLLDQLGPGALRTVRSILAAESLKARGVRPATTLLSEASKETA